MVGFNLVDLGTMVVFNVYNRQSQWSVLTGAKDLHDRSLHCQLVPLESQCHVCIYNWLGCGRLRSLPKNGQMSSKQSKTDNARVGFNPIVGFILDEVMACQNRPRPETVVGLNKLVWFIT